jgi:hypothetical protein
MVCEISVIISITEPRFASMGDFTRIVGDTIVVFQLSVQSSLQPLRVTSIHLLVVNTLPSLNSATTIIF